MKPRIANPIRRDELDSEIRAALDRYLAKLKVATGTRWRVKHLYKPTSWFRARVTSSQGHELILWYRPKRRYWTVIHYGRGVLRRKRRRPRNSDAETGALILEAMKGLGPILTKNNSINSKSNNEGQS